MLLKERRGRRRSILTRPKDRNSDQTVITSMCHISSGASEGGTLDGLAEEKEDKKKKKPWQFFCTVAKAGGGVRSHPAVINLLAEVKVWGREKWNKLWERRVEMLQWERSGRKRCHRGVTAGRGWKAETTWKPVDDINTCAVLWEASCRPPYLKQLSWINELHSTEHL